LTSLGQHGDRVGTTIALVTSVTGAESGARLAEYLDRVDTGSLGVCFSPGNVVVGGQDPRALVRAVGKRIAYLHATDARHSSSRGAALVPVGHGYVDWLQLLGTLEEVAYRGCLTVAADAGADAPAAIRFLKHLSV